MFDSRVTASRLALATALLALAGCDQPTPSGPPPGVPAALRIVGGDGQPGVTGAELPEALVVAAVDADGNPVSGIDIQFVVVAGGGQVTPQVSRSDAQGLARTRWTLGTVAADSQVVEARLDRLAAIRLRAAARPDQPVTLTLSGGGAAGQVGAPLADSLAVLVRDRYGNPVDGVEVTWNVAAGGGSVSPARGVTGAGGMSRVQWTLGTRVDSAQGVFARVAGLDSVVFTANAVTAGVPLQLAKRGGDAQRGPAGSVLLDSLGVVLRMQDGRPVQGAVVSWSVPPTGGMVTPPVSRTDANGAASAVWRLGTSPGLVQATATVDEGTLTFTSLVEAGAPNQVEAVRGGGEGLVGRVMADSLVVRVTDAHGNPVLGAEVAWDAGAGSGVLQPARSTTDMQGFARAEWTLALRAGPPAQTATATLQGLPPVAFQAMATTRGVTLQLARTGGDGQTGTVGSVLSDSLTVQLRTPAGQPVQGATVTWDVMSGGGQVSPVTSRTDAHGRARAAWTLGARPGPGGASARVDDGALAFSATALVGAPAAVRVAGGSGQQATRGIPLADSIVARVEDAYGNPLPGVTVHWAVLTGGGQIETTATTTGADGTARTRWAMGFTPGENTAGASVQGLATARFTANALPGELKLQGGGQIYPVRTGMSTYTVDHEFYVRITDAQGNQTVGAPITWRGSDSPFVHQDWSGNYAHWQTSFGIIGGSLPYIYARFEDQEVPYYVATSWAYYLSFGVEWPPTGQYMAQDTAFASVQLGYSDPLPVTGYWADATVSLHDDNGWTATVSTYAWPTDRNVSWPLGNKTGTRTLTACVPETLPGEEYCVSQTITVGP